MITIAIKKIYLYAIVGVILAGFSIVFFALRSFGSKLTTITANVNVATLGLEVGNLAPDFQLTDSDGKIFTRSSFAGNL